MMIESIIRILDELLDRYPSLIEQRESIIGVYNVLEESYANGGKLLVAGNGGSAADSEHIVGELMKAFIKPRKLDESLQNKLKSIDDKLGQVLADNLQGALPAIAVTGHVGLSTAYLNDCNPLLSFAQQVNGFGNDIRDYNVLLNNCDIKSLEWLKAGGIDLIRDATPNGTYNTTVDYINKGLIKREGMIYGDLYNIWKNRNTCLSNE